MAAILIKGNSENNKILAKLAEKLGSDVITINDDQYEDIAFGMLMDESKTGEIASRQEVMDKLRNK